MNNILEQIKSDDAFAQARARALITVYDEQWREKLLRDYEILDVENEFSFPLQNPDTGGFSRSFDEAGKIDVLTRRRSTNKTVVIEHKTTSDSVAEGSDYWSRLTMDSQISKYFLAATQDGSAVEGILYDVIRKPGQRPSQIPKLDADGCKIVLDPHNNRVMTKDGKKPRETADAAQGWILQTTPETAAQFEVRLLSVLRAAPGDYFAQKDVPRLDSQILEMMKDDWALGQQLLYARSHNLWPRNPQACDAMGTCEMFGLCSGRASIDGFQYAKKSVVHSELKIQGGERQLLTNSRANAYRKCARYHFHKYEEPIEIVRDEDANSALRFGMLVHQGLEAYFLAMKNNTLK